MDFVLDYVIKEYSHKRLLVFVAVIALLGVCAVFSTIAQREDISSIYEAVCVVLTKTYDSYSFIVITGFAALCAINVFVSLCSLVKKLDENYSAAKVQVVTIAVSAVLGLTWGVVQARPCTSCFFLIDYDPPMKFDSSKWISAPEYRRNMLSDLKEHYKLKGLSEFEAISLLGKPNEFVRSDSGNTVMIYDMKVGHEYHYFQASISLYFEKGKVCRTSVYLDS